MSQKTKKQDEDVRFLAPQWLGATQAWEQQPWGLVQWAPAPELWKDLQLWTPQCCLFPPWCLPGQGKQTVN